MDENQVEEKQITINSLPAETLEKIFFYLTLKEAFVYQRVCRRWNQLIFNKQQEFDLKKELNVGIIQTYEKEPQKMCEFLHLLFTKCVFIKNIDLMPYRLDVSHIKVMIEFCHRLQRVKIMVHSFTDEEEVNEMNRVLIELMLKFGHDLKQMRVLGVCIKLKLDLIKCCSKIESFNDGFEYKAIDSFGMRFNHLKSVRIDVGCFADIESLLVFTQEYCTQIEVIKLKFSFASIPVIKASLQQIVNYINLRELKIKVFFVPNVNKNDTQSVINNELISIATKCLKLKIFYYCGISLHQLISGKVFDVLGYYSHINRLVVKDNSIDVSDLCQYQNESISSLNRCVNLHKLVLYLQLNHETFFKNIHLIVQNLTYIQLKGYLSDATLHSLSEMQKLHTIILLSKKGWQAIEPTITEKGICDTIKRCKPLRRLIIDCGLYFSDFCIKELIQLASIHSHNNYIFSFDKIDDIHNFLIPPNVKLIKFSYTDDYLKSLL